MEEAKEQKLAKYHERSAGGKGGSLDAKLRRWVVRDSGHFAESSPSCGPGLEEDVQIPN